MLAGIGKAVLTPPLLTELAGYGYYLQRKAQSVQDDLFARAVALEQDGRRYCIISCDLLGLNANVAKKVRGRLFEQNACPPEHTMLVSIHTHTGPAIKHHEGTGEINPLYVETVADTILSACAAAFNAMAPVEAISFAMQEASACFAYNRTGESLPPDNNVRAFTIKRAGARPIALISHACHAVSRGKSTAVSADYPGQLCALMAAKGIDAIYLNGACGDIDPLPPHGGDLAERIAQSISDALKPSSKPLALTISGGILKESLQLMPVTAEKIRQAATHAAENESIPGGAKVARIWEKAMLDKLPTLLAEEVFSVQWLCLCGIPIVALPFEAFSLTAQLIREAIGDSHTLVLGCADELLGYLPTRADMAKSSYAALESTFLYKRLPPQLGEAERLGISIGLSLKQSQEDAQ
jgi:Neutral/alkaline non-lysosomal ceramidase.